MEEAGGALNVRQMEERDVAAIVEIQAETPEIAQWTSGDYASAARGEMAGWVAEEKGEMAGFLVARRVAGDSEILNLAVRPSARRNGIGSSLLHEAVTWSRSFQADKIFIEVRASNLSALRFYERHGFSVTGRRAGYYVAPVEDAIMLEAALT